MIIWIRAELIFIVLTRMIQIYQALLHNTFGDFYYSNIPLIPEKGQIIEGDYCSPNDRGKWVHWASMNGSLVYDLIGLGILFI